MHSRQNALDEVSLLNHSSASQLVDTQQRLLNLGESFAGLETKGQAFQAAQSTQAAIQRSLHDQVNKMHTEMRVAHGLLTDITSSASRLQTAIEETSTQISQMATLTGVTSAILRWGWVILGVFFFTNSILGMLGMPLLL